jgi:two-component system C4-dicarboxylate transport response regulator DctD
MTVSGKILLVEDEAPLRLATAQTLELAGFDVVAVENAAKALKRISADWPGIVISDIRLPQMDGMELMRRLAAIDSGLPVILVTGHGDVGMAVSAMRDGAYDFIEKPFDPAHLVDVSRRALEKRALVLENRALKRRLAESGDAAIVGQTPALEKLRRTIFALADYDADVLVTGETGTGKEMVARALHDHSRRKKSRFVALNCGAMPESIFESELFGHEAGAFTGAAKARVGKVQHADGGTLFLDEIESMPLALQVKILRVLQERAVEPLGGNETVPVNVRVVAASKVDLKRASLEGSFRQDLFYRLNVATIDIPPLRERRDDIPLLFQHFLAASASKFQREAPSLAPGVLRRLMAHDWPGNVRELKAAAERYVLGLDDDVTGGAEGLPLEESMSLPEQVDAFEKTLIARALDRHKGSVKSAIEELGVPRKTFYDKLSRYGLSRGDFTE